MSDATQATCDSAGAGAKPVDEALAASLTEQGEGGARALGLLRDAYRMLTDDRYERSAEIAESCLRNAVDALLKLPGGGTPRGLQSAARDLLKAVNAYQPDGRRDPQTALQRMRQAADELRVELDTPGGYHRRRAKGVAERVMDQRLGAAQEDALDAWGELYGATSNVLHGSASQQAAARYQHVVRLAREVFVPLPGRAEQILELAERQEPTAQDAAQLAEWADPRATRYFFLSRPAAAWLELLDEVLLLPDTSTPAGYWPAAPYLDHLTQTAPDRVRPWLDDHAAAAAAAGPDATAALLRLAARPGIALTRGVRAVITDLTKPERDPRTVHGGLLYLAADWARDIPLTDRNEDWIRTAEVILRAAVRAEHATDQEIRAAAQDDSLTDDQVHERLAALSASRLSGWDTGQLLAALVHTAHPHADRKADNRPTPTTEAHPHVRTIRYVLAALLRLDTELTDPASRHGVVFCRDLAEVSVQHPEAFLGPVVARAVLDLAAADARAGVGLAERTEALAGKQLAQVDSRLRDRLLAAHLEQTGPDAVAADPAGEEAVWWEQARALVPVLLAHRPAPESARLTDLVHRLCPPDAAEAFHAELAAAFGTPPGPEELAAYEPDSARPPRTWLRVWDWSPVLPGAVTASWEPALAVLRTIRPSGPPDPRAADPLVEIEDPEPPAVTADQAIALAAGQGPAAAAAALADAPDAGGTRYLMVLRTVIDSDPVAWTAAPAQIAAALALPELRAFYLSIAADHTRTPGAFPGQALAEAAITALTWSAESGDPDQDEDEPPAEYLAGQALFDLLTAAWRTDTDLGDHLPAALDHLYALTTPLTTPAPTIDGSPADTFTGDFVGTDPAGRALQCLLEHARHHDRATGEGMLDRLRHHLDLVIEATGRTARTSAALGRYLPQLHRQAPSLLHDHSTALLALPDNGTSSAASSWLHWGPAHPPLLAKLDRGAILARLRQDTPPEAFDHTAHALLTDPTALGDPQTLFIALADGEGGPTAVSRLLERIAHLARGVPAATVSLWQAALAASLPEGALAGAGAFADLDIDATTWLDLSLASARHTPPAQQRRRCGPARRRPPRQRAGSPDHSPTRGSSQPLAVDRRDRPPPRLPTADRRRAASRRPAARSRPSGTARSPHQRRGCGRPSVGPGQRNGPGLSPTGRP